MQRVVVEECKLFDPGLLRERERLPVRRVTEAGMCLVLLRAVLRVMHQQVGVPAPVGELFQRPIGAVGEERDLIVGGKRETRRSLVDEVAEGWDRMHQQVRSDAQCANLESLALIALDELHLRRHVAQADGKVRGVGLVGERGLQRFRRASRPNDRQMGAGNERRQKKRKPLDVVEVSVRDQQVGLQRLGRAEGAAELGDPRPRVDHQQVVLLVPDLDARGVAAVAQGPASRRGSRAPRAPELDPHRPPAG